MDSAIHPAPRVDRDLFLELVRRMGDQARQDIDWAEGIRPPADAERFAFEAIWIICNSGMKHSVARLIEGRVLAAIAEGKPVREAFRHPGKAAAMQEIWDRREEMFAAYLASEDRMAFIEGMPWIGKITKYHLAKNYGLDEAKPDVHMQRLADREGMDVRQMCERIASATGYRIATVDLILWRACATGLLDSRTGVLAPE